jgi:hypothetical protein
LFLFYIINLRGSTEITSTKPILLSAGYPPCFAAYPHDLGSDSCSEYSSLATFTKHEWNPGFLHPKNPAKPFRYKAQMLPILSLLTRSKEALKSVYLIKGEIQIRLK